MNFPRSISLLTVTSLYVISMLGRSGMRLGFLLLTQTLPSALPSQLSPPSPPSPPSLNKDIPSPQEQQQRPHVTPEEIGQFFLDYHRRKKEESLGMSEEREDVSDTSQDKEGRSVHCSLSLLSLPPCLYGDVDGERILVSIASLSPSFILVPLSFSHPPPFVHKLPNDCCLNKSL